MKQEQQHISVEKLIAYLKDELSPREKERVSNLIEQNEFYQEALQGLKSIDSPGHTSEIIQELNRRIREKTGRKSPVKGSQYIQLAAAILIAAIIISGTVWLVRSKFLQRPGQVADQETPAKQERVSGNANRLPGEQPVAATATERKDSAEVPLLYDVEDHVLAGEEDSKKDQNILLAEKTPPEAESVEDIRAEKTEEEKPRGREVSARVEDDAIDAAATQKNEQSVEAGAERDEREPSREPALLFMVEEAPQFPGGEKALKDHIQLNLQYPEEALEAGESGTVIVEMVINENGEVQDPKIIKSVSGSLDREALRVVRNMPDWKPGKLKGENVPVRMNIPVKFTP